MSFFDAISALLWGFKSCLFEPRMRKLAMKPWAFGAVFYLLAMVGAYFAHAKLVVWLVGEQTGFWATIFYGLVWFGSWILLLGLGFVVTLTLVMIFTGIYQTDIARLVMEQRGVSLPPPPEGLSGAVGDGARTITIETLKLFWLVPLILVSILIGLIPILMPISLALTAWLMAYQFVDIPLDLMRYGFFKRIGAGVRYAPQIVVFGLSILLVWAIPFVGMLLPPVAVAGAAYLVSGSRYGAIKP